MNKTQLAEAIVAKHATLEPARLRIDTREKAIAAVDAVLDVIMETVTQGQDVSVSNFGTFRFIPNDGGATLKRNPRTGDQVAVPHRNAVRFRVGPGFREAVATANLAKATNRKAPRS